MAEPGSSECPTAAQRIERGPLPLLARLAQQDVNGTEASLESPRKRFYFTRASSRHPFTFRACLLSRSST